MNSFSTFIRKRLADHEQRGLWRESFEFEGSVDSDYTSNDYLGFASEPVVGLESSPSGSGGSRFLGGHFERVSFLEKQFAEWKGVDDAVFFSSGYLANLALAGLCEGSQVSVFSDRMNHASIVDGLRLRFKRGPYVRYAHNDLENLNELLERETSAVKIVVAESLFSMNGDWLDFDLMRKVCADHSAALILDESHSIGICGPQGAGMLSGKEFNDMGREGITMQGCGKAFGFQGAFWAGAKDYMDAVRQFSRSYIYTTAPSPLNVEVALLRLRDIKLADARRANLCKNIEFVSGALNLKIKSPIVPIRTLSKLGTQTLQRDLENKGFGVRLIRPPTVPEGQECIRLTIRANHSLESLSEICRVIKMGFECHGKGL